MGLSLRRLALFTLFSLGAQGAAAPRAPQPETPRVVRSLLDPNVSLSYKQVSVTCTNREPGLTLGSDLHLRDHPRRQGIQRLCKPPCKCRRGPAIRHPHLLLVFRGSDKPPLCAPVTVAPRRPRCAVAAGRPERKRAVLRRPRLQTHRPQPMVVEQRGQYALH
jgi:hypothetical protein